MLVLSRKPDESIVISGKIVVTILSVEGERVRIGISAPPEISVVRQELIERDAHEREKQARERSERPLIQ
jgi:carbon storage regulator